MSILNTIAKKEVKRELTEKQKSFLNYLVETKGDMKEAAKLAGYSSSHHSLVKSLKSEILELTAELLATAAPKAAFKLVEIMESTRPIVQAANKLAAATTVLDRVGVVKIDRVDVNHSVGGGIFLMPDKAPIQLDEEHYDVIEEE
jgi:phage terminase small subunit